MNKLLAAAAFYFTLVDPEYSVQSMSLYWQQLRLSMQPPKGKLARLVYHIVEKKVEKKIEDLGLLLDVGVLYMGEVRMEMPSVEIGSLEDLE